MKSSAVKTRSKSDAVPTAPVSAVYLTPAEVSDRFRIRPFSLANMRNRGDGPEFVKFGSRVLYPLDKLEEYLKSRTFSRKAGK